MRCKDDSLTARLNKRVTIKTPTYERDSHGQSLMTWTDFATVWAAIEPLQGREYYAAQQENVDVTTRIRIRYREGVDRTMIVKFGVITFEILSVIHPKFAKKELQLMCKERQ